MHFELLKDFRLNFVLRFRFLGRGRRLRSIDIHGSRPKAEKYYNGLSAQQCRPNEVSEADYAFAIQRTNIMIFEFFEFSFEFHFLIFILLFRLVWGVSPR
jgi:hypothetical protein